MLTDALMGSILILCYPYFLNLIKSIIHLEETGFFCFHSQPHSCCSSAFHLLYTKRNMVFPFYGFTGRLTRLSSWPRSSLSTMWMETQRRDQFQITTYLPQMLQLFLYQKQWDWKWFPEIWWQRYGSISTGTTQLQLHFTGMFNSL